jgi:alpha-D-ribose 1-methylphosphonate 5-triphosphate synthase subunit PhnI
MYVAVKGGERAIDAANGWVAKRRRGDPTLAPLTVAQIQEQLHQSVARVMAEGALYDPQLAALAIKQAAGDLVEAAFLLRAYRTTLPRLADSLPIDTARMRIERRISATFKEVPGGQILGPTIDYGQRLLDFSLLEQEETVDPTTFATVPTPSALTEPPPRVTDLMGRDGLLESELVPPGDPAPADLTRQPLRFPAARPLRLQALARGDEGYLLGMAYSTQRGYAHTHPFVGELRVGRVEVSVLAPELGFPVVLGEIELTECQMINQFAGSDQAPPMFTRGYGLVFGQGERKSIAMALVDRALRARELGEPETAPAQDQEFVLSHCDNLEASGFVQHLKLPHHVDFQSELELLRRLRTEHGTHEAIDLRTAPSLDGTTKVPAP